MKSFEIISILLENIKTYISEEIHFTKGNNVLIGENGAGKSTILESIYLSIFGDTVPGRNLVDMIRFGERQGKVTIKFSVDGTNYRIDDEITKKDENRAIQTQTLYDETIDETIAEGRSAVKVKVEEILGIDSTAFISAVYASQGEIANIAIAKEMDRKKLFDRLFQIDRYEKSWQNLAKLEKLVKQNVENNQTRLELILQDILKLPELKVVLNEKEELLKEESKKISQLNRQFNQIDNLYKQKKNAMIEHTKLSTQKESLDKEIKELDNTFRLSFQDLKKKSGEMKLEANVESLINLRNKSEEKFESLKQILENSKEIEKSMLLTLEKLNALENNIIQLQDNIEKRRKQLSEEIIHYLECFPELGDNPATWTKKMKPIETEIQVALKEKQEKQQLMEEIKQELKNKNEKELEKENSLNRITQKYVQKRFSLTSIAGENWQEIASQLGEINFKDQLSDLTSLKEKLEEELSNLNSKKSILVTTIERIKRDFNHLKALQGEETCPTCKQKLSSTLLKKLKEELLKEKENSIKERNEINSKSTIRNQEIFSLKEKIKNSQEKQMTFEKISPILNDLHELEGDKKLLEKELSELKTKIIELESSLEKGNYNELCHEIVRLEQLIFESSNIKKTLPRLTETYVQIDDDVKKKIALEKEQKELEKKHAHQKLDEAKQKVLTIENEMKELTDFIHYNKLLLNEKEKIEKRKNELAIISTKVKVLEDREGIKDYTKIEEEWKELNDKIISKKSDIKNLKEEIIPPLSKQLDDLLLKEIQMEKLRDKLELEKQKEKIVTILRGLMRVLPNKLLPNYIDKINNTATAILHSMIPESDIQGIELNSDYSLNIIRHGNIENISILSGGETIIVALALRLAFAKEFSTLDTLILDEPTIFLDERRRSELVSVLEKNRLVGQMFVVTHDPDFERISDQTFIVNKDRSETSIKSIDSENRFRSNTDLDLSL